MWSLRPKDLAVWSWQPGSCLIGLGSRGPEFCAPGHRVLPDWPAKTRGLPCPGLWWLAVYSWSELPPWGHDLGRDTIMSSTLCRTSASHSRFPPTGLTSTATKGSSVLWSQDIGVCKTPTKGWPQLSQDLLEAAWHAASCSRDHWEWMLRMNFSSSAPSSHWNSRRTGRVSISRSSKDASTDGMIERSSASASQVRTTWADTCTPGRTLGSTFVTK